MFTIVAIGCGDHGGPDPEQQTKGVQAAKSMRSYFDKTGGDYGRLSDQEKSEYLKIFDGDSKRAEEAWNGMKYGPGYRPNSGSMPTQTGAG